jgi:hypothetical protein
MMPQILFDSLLLLGSELKESRVRIRIRITHFVLMHDHSFGHDCRAEMTSKIEKPQQSKPRPNVNQRAARMRIKVGKKCQSKSIGNDTQRKEKITGRNKKK